MFLFLLITLKQGFELNWFLLHLDFGLPAAANTNLCLGEYRSKKNVIYLDYFYLVDNFINI